MKFDINTPEIELIMSLSAFCRFATSSVIRTTVGSFWLLSPRVAGCIKDICALYHAAALRIPVHSIYLSQGFLTCEEMTGLDHYDHSGSPHLPEQLLFRYIMEG